ncbi:MAG: Methyltransferase domain [Candidatus Parcubacteria bacterium]|jgi:cyclopropane fatty-acyl-phospholipid synthase-like methyltransferase
MTSKEFFFDVAILEAMGGNLQQPLRVLELGCGTAKYVPAMIEKYPNLTYVGVEPIDASFARAQKNLNNVLRTQVVHQLGYDTIESVDVASFDLVISFSVLEHVKHLDRFLTLGAKYLKQGGYMVHRYDLGHALYPTTLKEMFHVWVGNTFPSVLPERTFVRYVPQTEVADHFKTLLHVEPYKYTYHQMPNQKRLEEALRNIGYEGPLMESVFAWEFEHAEDFARIPTRTREKLFPTVAVWGRKG